MAEAPDAYAAEWRAKARQDFERVGRRLAEGDTEDAAFHLQQALEKALKSYLLMRGWKLHKIHDVEALLDEAVVKDATLEAFRSSGIHHWLKDLPAKKSHGQHSVQKNSFNGSFLRKRF